MGHLRLPLEEQPLNLERADLFGMQRPEDHVQGDPVGGPAHHQAEERQYPPALIKVPDSHLNKAEQEAEIETGIHNKAKLCVATLQENAVQQLLVGRQFLN